MCIVLFYGAVPDVLENKLDYYPAVCVVTSMYATTDADEPATYE